MMIAPWSCGYVIIVREAIIILIFSNSTITLLTSGIESNLTITLLTNGIESNPTITLLTGGIESIKIPTFKN